MKPAEVIEVLLAKLAVPSGRHLYGVLGSHSELDAFAHELVKIWLPDGKRSPDPL